MFEGDFEYTGGNVTLAYNNVVFANARNRDNCKGVSVRHLPEGHAQWDHAIMVRWLYPRKRKWDRFYSVLTPDGTLGLSIEIDGAEVWNSEDIFPVFDSLAIARANREAQSKLELARGLRHITAEEFLEKFKELVHQANVIAV